HFAQLLAQKFDKQTELPVPLLIALRYHTDSPDLRVAIVDELTKNGIALANGGTTVDWLIRSGRLLLIFDGADESKSAHYRAQLLASEKCKVIITCRSHYFHSDSEFKNSWPQDTEEHPSVKLLGFDDKTVAQAI